MNKENVGSIILTLRMRMHISQKDLCRGLCTNRTLSRIELGERVPDKLLLDALLQRLGKSPDKLETILSEKEYMFFCQRRSIERDIIKYDFEKAKSKLEDYKKQKKCKDILQRQYIYKIEAVLADEMEHNVGKSIYLLKQAAEMTMPNWEEGDRIDFLLGIEEVQILLILAQNYSKIGREKKAIKLLIKLYIYLETKYSDEEEKVKVYPRCVYLLANLLWKNERYDETVKICEKAIDLLTKNGVINYLEELMNIYSMVLQKQGNLKLANKIEKQRENLLEVYNEYGMVMNKRKSSILLVNTQSELFLYNEIIKYERINSGKTQEQLSESICSPETLSRIESGKRAPSRKNFKAIMNKLGIEKSIYSSYISANEFEVYEQKRNLSKYIARHQYEEAYNVFNSLKRKMDCTILENKQFILSTEVVLNHILGRISRQEALEKNLEALSYTFEEYERGIYRTLSRQETVILNQIAVIYKKLGNRKKAIRILRDVLKSYENSKIDLMYHYSMCALVMINLSAYLEEEQEINSAIEICDKGIKLDLKCGRGNRLGAFLTNKACSLEHAGDKEKCLKYFRQAFYLSDLMQNIDDKETIKKYFEQTYNSNEIWY